MQTSIQVHTAFRGSATSLRMVLALALASCGIETDGGPGKGDAGAGGDSGSSGDAGSSGSGGSGSGGDGGAAGSVAGVGGAGSSGQGGAGMSGDGGDAGAGTGGSSSGCDEGRSPKDEPCLVDDDLALFVSSDGTSTADGTMSEPLSSVRLAVEKAVQSGIARVIVCEGTYSESLVIEDAVEVYGGFSCDGGVWDHSGGMTVVQPSGVGSALRIEDVEEAVVIEGMSFVSRAATAAGGSSIAAVVVGSDAVTLRDVTLEAGSGKAGEAGETDDFEFPSTGAGADTCADMSMMCLAGYPAVLDSGGPQREYTCPAGDETVGGLGGPNSVGGAQAGDPGFPDLGAGAGGTASCSAGGGGADAQDGNAGDGATRHGSMSGGSWVPASGDDGDDGEVGQGGGGGGAQDPAGGGGGGGGGGCGGASGGAGQGGGASIDLLSLSSDVVLEDCVLRANDGGDGGSGSEGQDGMESGGIGGAGACTGGVGGAGGKGGAGGGGAGGISAGIVWTDTEPTVDDDTAFDLGSPGAGGEGGDDSITTDDGIDGEAVEVLEG